MSNTPLFLSLLRLLCSVSLSSSAKSFPIVFYTHLFCLSTQSVLCRTCEPNSTTQKHQRRQKKSRILSAKSTHFHHKYKKGEGRRHCRQYKEKGLVFIVSFQSEASVSVGTFNVVVSLSFSGFFSFDLLCIVREITKCYLKTGVERHFTEGERAKTRRRLKTKAIIRLNSYV